ncbi:hypothetical protein GJ496_008883 [Pomphorhynchus laevis]|nr:hypothetical protein GJ496_008883 [Pomphorhynchus laevis]
MSCLLWRLRCTFSDLLRKHGPGQGCPGSGQLSLRLVYSDNSDNDKLNKAHGSVSRPVLLLPDMSLLADNVRRIRHISRSAMPSVTAKLAELTDAVVSHPDEEAAWWRMLPQVSASSTDENGFHAQRAIDHYNALGGMLWLTPANNNALGQTIDRRVKSK